MPGAFPVLFSSLKRLIDSDAGAWRDFMYFFRALSTTVFILPCNKDWLIGVLMPIQQFFSYIRAKQVNFQWDEDEDEVCFVLDQHAESDF